MKVVKMKVLLTVPSLDVPKFKGLAKVSAKLVEGLKDKVDLEVLEVFKAGKHYLRYIYNLTSIPLRQAISKADIIHSVTPESGALISLLKPTVITFHDFIPYTQDIKLRDFILLYTDFMWGTAVRNAKALVAVSSLTAKLLEKIYKRKAIVINPGVDEKFKPMKVKKEKLTLGFFANFSYRKGVDKAIEVYKLVKEKIDCKLILAGGKLQTVYQKQFDVEKMIKGLKDVEIKGYIPEEKVVELYNSFDFFLFPSQMEGFGIPILEAQKCGVPVFVFKDALIPKEAKAKAIECNSVEDMANKIIKLANDRKTYKKIREEGIKYAKKFSWKNVAKAYLKIYESIGK